MARSFRQATVLSGKILCKLLQLCANGIPLLMEDHRPMPCQPPWLSEQRCPTGFWCHEGEDGANYYCCQNNGKSLNRCHLPPAVGFGKQKMRRFYYDPIIDGCHELYYTGIGGNENNFVSYEQCEQTCRGCFSALMQVTKELAIKNETINSYGSFEKAQPASVVIPQGVSKSWEVTTHSIAFEAFHQQTTAKPRLEEFAKDISTANGSLTTSAPKGIIPAPGQPRGKPSSSKVSPLPNSESRSITPLISQYTNVQPIISQILLIPQRQTTANVPKLHEKVATISTRPTVIHYSNPHTFFVPGSTMDNISVCLFPMYGDVVIMCALESVQCPAGTFCQIGDRQSICCPTPIGNKCEQPVRTGVGPSSLPRWYFDPTARECLPFLFRGFQGNQNNFENFSQCQLTCNDRPEQFFFKERPLGGMNGSLPQVFSCCLSYHVELRQYSTVTILTCSELCLDNFTQCVFSEFSGKRPTACDLPVISGHGNRFISRFFFSNDYGQCLHFIYSGEGGNSNNFANIHDCHQTCMRTKNQYLCKRFYQMKLSALINPLATYRLEIPFWRDPWDSRCTTNV
uniref:Kunitz/Bovine pancreatic trypsin inhibitor domain protein n=1 Tax=Angiostrongylus cantonensis TaxID=6313 RepID=A0A158P873_ANGCA